MRLERRSKAARLGCSSSGRIAMGQGAVPLPVVIATIAAAAAVE